MVLFSDALNAETEYLRSLGADRPSCAGTGVVQWQSALHPKPAMVTDATLDVAECELHELEQALTAFGSPRFHGRQIFQWIHKRGVTDFALMSDLSRELRTQL